MSTDGTRTDLAPSRLYGAGARELQDTFDTRRLADRLVQLTLHAALTDDDITLIRAQSTVWIATVDADGWPDVSYKGGNPGFVHVIDPRLLRIPSFDGNGMFRSLGNVQDNGRVGLLFLDPNRPWRMRVHGRGRVSTRAEDCAAYTGAQAVLEIEVLRVFPNCGRYIHTADGISPSVPQPDRETPMAPWKRFDAIRDALPAEDIARLDAEAAAQGNSTRAEDREGSS